MNKITVINNRDDLMALPEGQTTHATIGAFDGIHIGHQALIRRTVETAQAADAIPAVLTFSNHPLSVLAPSYMPPRLTPDDLRVRLFEDLGLRLIVLIPFDRAVANLSAEVFIREILAQRLRARHVVCGYDFQFGQGGSGNVETLSLMGRQFGISVECMEPVKIRGIVVSSTKIREMVTQGMVATAAEFLGRPYSIRGRVIKGFGRGRHLSYPTANLEPRDDLLIPAYGVYAVRVIIDNHCYNGMMSIGTNPTFEPQHFSIEAHVFDFDGDLVDRTIEIYFIQRLRMEMKFDGAEALVEQLRRDEQYARRFLARPG